MLPLPILCLAVYSAFVWLSVSPVRGMPIISYRSEILALPLAVGRLIPHRAGIDLVSLRQAALPLHVTAGNGVLKTAKRPSCSTFVDKEAASDATYHHMLKHLGV